ncbi:transcription factor bHLH35-like [Henckelia pumila]|uniref:transcription factor bHLH35-like n=1 Tax=Henckelia pumila TaxID=405737 RepID=UPI003C6E825E
MNSKHTQINMENFDDDQCKHYWENMYLQNEDLESYFDEVLSTYYDSSSPDGIHSSLASKNIASERNRRKKLNERLYALRSVVPTITKMDKASIIKDAIEYIQKLHEEDKSLEAEISELENGRSSNSPIRCDFDQEFCSKAKRSRMDQYDHGPRFKSYPLEVLELRVSSMGEKTVVVSLTCNKRTDTIVKLCEVFESLKLKIITASITAFSGRILKTVFVEADEDEKELLRANIESAIARMNDPDSPLSN